MMRMAIILELDYLLAGKLRALTTVKKSSSFHASPDRALSAAGMDVQFIRAAALAGKTFQVAA